MARNQGQLNFGVNFNVNTASLDKVRNTLRELSKLSKEQIEAGGGKVPSLSTNHMKSWKNDLGEMRKDLAALERAFEAAYNPKINSYEISKFNESLKESGTSAERAFQTIANYGDRGKAALLDMSTNMLAVDRAAKSVNSTFQKLGDTMMNTVRWSITSSAVNSVTGSIERAFHYAEDLDKSLNNIRIVTEKSAEDMEEFARQANKAAKELGVTTRDYTEASLIYYQQGLSDEDVKVRTDITTKVAAITGQSADEVSKQLTAVWNGYKVSAEESELYIDKLSAVAASTSADLESLSTGMSKVASAANTMGVDIDQLGSMIATVESVTQQAPESVGTAFKTIFARMGDIEAGLDTETTLGEYTSKMAEMGINVLNANGELRDMGAVIEEIGGKWNTMTREQQVALSKTMAGTRQYNNLLALFDSWDMYQKTLNVSLEAAGTLTEQHNKKLESTEAHYNKLTASLEGLYDSIFDSEDINDVYDTLSGIVTLIDELVQAMGGMKGILAAVALIIAKTQKARIADLLTMREQNKLSKELNQRQLEAGRKNIEELSKRTTGNSVLDNQLKTVLNFEKEIYDMASKGSLTDEQWNSLQAGMRSYNELAQKAVDLTKELQDAKLEETEAFKGGSVTRDKGGKRKTTVIGGQSYYLAEDEDGKNSKGEKRLGLASAKKRQFDLHELKLQGELTEEQEKELKILNDKIPKAEKENKARKKRIDLEEKEQKELKGLNAELDREEEAIKAKLELDQKMNKITSAIDNIATAGYMISGVSSSVSDLTSTIMDGNAALEDYIGGISGLLTSLSPLAPTLISAIQAVNAAKIAAKKSGEGALTAAAGWQVFNKAFGFGWALLAISAITAVISALVTYEKKQKEAAAAARERAVEEAKAKQEEAESVKKSTGAWLELYDAYQKTGEGAEELIEAGLALAESLGRQDIKVLALKKNYEGLAEAIRLTQVTAAKEKKQGLKDELDANIKAWGDEASWTGDSVSDLSKDTRDKLETALNEKDFHATVGYNGSLNFWRPKDKEGVETIISILEEQLKDSNLNKNDRERIESTLSTYIAQKETWAPLEAKISLEDALIEMLLRDASTTSLDQFHDIRENQINQIMKDKNVSRAEAEYEVSNYFAGVGGNVAKMEQRETWLSGAKSDFAKEEDFENFRTSLSNENLSDAEWEALQRLNIEDYGGDKEAIFAAITPKLQEIRDEAWAALTDGRLAALDKELNRLEKTGEGLNLEEQVENIVTQSGILQKTWATQQKTYANTVDSFLKTAVSGGVGEALQKEINSAIIDQNWEGLHEKIMGADLDEDLKTRLLNQIEDMMGASNNLAESEAEWLETLDKITEKRIESLEKVNEAYEKQKEYLESIGDLLEHQKDLTELAYGEGADLSAYWASALDNATKIEASNQSAYEYWAAEYKAQKASGTATKEELDYLEEQMINSGEAYADSITNTAKVAKDAFKNALGAAIEDYNKALSGDDRSFGALSSEWEWMKEDRSNYLSPLDAQFGQEKLRNTFRKAINSTTDVKVQQQIANLMNSQLNSLKEMDKISQKDLDRAEQKLKILEAEIALQNAQDAKTQMRLVRGADGTYSYQYTADESAISEAQNNLNAAYQAQYQSDREAYEANLDSWESTWSEYQDKYKEFYEDDGEIDDEEEAELDRYWARLEEIQTENSKLKVNLEESIRESGEVLGLDATEITSNINEIFGSGLQTFIDNWDNDMESGQAYFTAFTDTITTEAEAAFGETGTVTTAFTKMNTLLGGEDNPESLIGRLNILNESLDIQAYKNQASAVDELKTSYKSLNDELKLTGDNLDTMIKKWEIWMGKQPTADDKKHAAVQQGINALLDWDSGGDSGKESNTAYVTAQDSYIAAGGKREAFQREVQSAIDTKNEKYTYDEEFYDSINGQIYTGTFPGTETKGLGGIDGIGDWDKVTFAFANGEKAENIQIPQNGYEASSEVADRINSLYKSDGLTPDDGWVVLYKGIPYVHSKGSWRQIVNSSSKGNFADTVKDIMLKTLNPHFKTGGLADFTGPAWLDGTKSKPELVLNQDETAHFLDALEILRSLNLSMLQNISGLSNISARTNFNRSSTPSIAQTIQINAEFPDATDANEIKEAFNELVNLATQKALENR